MSAAIRLAIAGMRCGGCAATVEKTLRSVPGVTDVRVDLAARRAEVSGTAPADVLVAAVQRAGYDARADGGSK
ncbi:MAG TPA: heavy metal-associated domain-containing protein [Burkholderiales bacterium]